MFVLGITVIVWLLKLNCNEIEDFTLFNSNYLNDINNRCGIEVDINN